MNPTLRMAIVKEGRIFMLRDLEQQLREMSLSYACRDDWDDGYMDAIYELLDWVSAKKSA